MTKAVFLYRLSLVMPPELIKAIEQQAQLPKAEQNQLVCNRRFNLHQVWWLVQHYIALHCWDVQWVLEDYISEYVAQEKAAYIKAVQKMQGADTIESLSLYDGQVAYDLLLVILRKV